MLFRQAIVLETAYLLHLLEVAFQWAGGPGNLRVVQVVKTIRYGVLHELVGPDKVTFDGVAWVELYQFCLVRFSELPVGGLEALRLGFGPHPAQLLTQLLEGSGGRVLRFSPAPGLDLHPDVEQTALDNNLWPDPAEGVDAGSSAVGRDGDGVQPRCL